MVKKVRIAMCILTSLIIITIAVVPVCVILAKKNDNKNKTVKITTNHPGLFFVSQTYSLNADISSLPSNVHYHWDVNPSLGITLNYANTPNITFNATDANTYNFQLTVKDNNNKQIASGEITIVINNET